MNTTDVPRPEYPRPQFRRDRWQNLNGLWEFDIDHDDTGLARGLDRPFERQILVPFCPESELSGVGETDFLDVVWYRREIEVPVGWRNERIVLHFGAVDHDTTVWVNGHEAGRHRGGFTSFSFDITEALDDGRATVVVRARDTRSEPQARGKQATWLKNSGCHYTRTTGIWQTVWIEPVAPTHFARPVIRPDVPNRAFRVTLPIVRPHGGLRVRASLFSAGAEVVTEIVTVAGGMRPEVNLRIPDPAWRLWSTEDPFLYDLKLTLLDEQDCVVDSFDSYAGMRSVRIEGQSFLINELPTFQRLVLDQGYYPDGLMTAPNDAALIRDIELAMAAGFNGARLHEKVFEERFLYHADRLGYLVWGEFGDWGAHTSGVGPEAQQPTASFITQWIEALERDQSHPSIIGWCGLNETFAARSDQITQLDDVTRGMFLAAKLIDGTRPVLDASGYAHRVPETDVYDSHSYEQDPDAFARRMSGLAEGQPYTNPGEDVDWSLRYAAQPYFCSEFGGIWWASQTQADADRSHSWGYGDRVTSLEDFYRRLDGLCQVLLGNELMFGFCYTQLTDVFQEQNGIYHFDRSPKFDLARIRSVFGAPAAYEATMDLAMPDSLPDARERRSTLRKVPPSIRA